MIRVLGLALYGPLAASTRYRLGQYVSQLASVGIEMQINCLLGDNYLRNRFGAGSLPIMDLLHAGFTRVSRLLHCTDYDLVMLHCELFPLFPWWIEHIMLSKPYIYDFDDAFYLKYRSGNMGILSPLLGSKFDSVISGAAAVTSGNSVLAEYAMKHNSNTCILPTVVDIQRYLPKASVRVGIDFTIGWIGSPSTAPYLSELITPLSVIGKEGPVRLVVIGGNAPVVPNVTVVEIDWQESTEIELINSFDVGVMPLPDNDWSRGKCAFKLIQYMACAIPVIASPVGTNIDLIKGDCGLFASTQQEWIDMFRMLRDQPVKCSQMGQAGRKRVVQEYSLHRNVPILADVIRKVAGKN